MTGEEITLEKKNAETTVPLNQPHRSAQGTEVTAGRDACSGGKHQHFVWKMITDVKVVILHLHTWWTNYLDIMCEFRVSLQFLFIRHLPRSSSLTARKGLD